MISDQLSRIMKTIIGFFGLSSSHVQSFFIDNEFWEDQWEGRILISTKPK